MIGFGELRKLSLQWHVDLADAERAYVTDWLLKGLYDQPALATILILRGSSAMRYAHFIDYPLADAPEFLATQTVPAEKIGEAIQAAAAISGIQFALADFDGGSAKLEYIGPLGRKSAAQPRITLSLIAGQTPIDPVRMPLLHRFSDPCAAIVVAEALEELAAQRIAVLGASPRARDVYDLWFIATHASPRIDVARVRTRADAIAQSKQIALPQTGTPFNPAHQAILARRWDEAMRDVLAHPTFTQVEQDLIEFLKLFFN